MFARARWLVVATTVLSVAPLITPAVHAQATPGCGSGNRLLRSTVGAALGGWAGLVAMKIRYSDWNDASRSRPGIRGRNRGIVVGAVLGASLGNLRFSAPCRSRGVGTQPPRSPSIRAITAAEIEGSGISGTVYDVVYSLRRQWLNARGIELSETPRVTIGERGTSVTPASNPTIVVYLDNVRLGDHAQLRLLPIDGVTQVRYFDASQATYRWGAGHNHGAIHVLTVTDGSR